jgi:ribosomal protein S18 acetylase RimI-like enzyme
MNGHDAAPAYDEGIERAIAGDAVSGFRVERVRLRDLRAVAAIQQRSFRRGLAYGMSALLILRFFPRTVFLVARDQASGEVIGCGIADRYRGDLRIMNLAVDPPQQRRGVGSALLERLERLSPAGNCVLMVEEWNTGAQALYERHGYVRSGFARNYYGPNRHGIWMKKTRALVPGQPGDQPEGSPDQRLYV